MLKLEQLVKDAQVSGLLPGEVARIVNVDEVGPNARLVAYRNAAGRLDEQTVFRSDEHRLSLAEAGRAWAFDADPAAFKLGLEAYRISLAHLFDPMMAVHTRATWNHCRIRFPPCTRSCCPGSRCALSWPTTPARARPSWPGC